MDKDLPGKDFWEDEDFWSQESYEGSSLKEEWKLATSEVSNYIEDNDLHGKHIPSILAKAWIRETMEAVIKLDDKRDKAELANMIIDDLCGSEDMGLTMNMFDLLKLKHNIPSGYAH